jgi:hypothetical protein
MGRKPGRTSIDARARATTVVHYLRVFAETPKTDVDERGAIAAHVQDLVVDAIAAGEHPPRQAVALALRSSPAPSALITYVRRFYVEGQPRKVGRKSRSLWTDVDVLATFVAWRAKHSYDRAMVETVQRCRLSRRTIESILAHEDIPLAVKRHRAVMRDDQVRDGLLTCESCGEHRSTEIVCPACRDHRAARGTGRPAKK